MELVKTSFNINNMTIQNLIDELLEIENKEQEIFICWHWYKAITDISMNWDDNKIVLHYHN